MTHNQRVALDRTLVELSHALTYEMRGVRLPQVELYFSLRDDVLEWKRELSRERSTQSHSLAQEEPWVDYAIAQFEENERGREHPRWTV